MEEERVRDVESRFAGSALRADSAAVLRRSLSGLGVLGALLGSLIVFAPSASAAEHNTVTGEYGKEGPKATGLGDGCRLAFQSVNQRLYLLSNNSVYGLQRSGPGSVAPLGGAFPFGVSRGDCGDPGLAVDNTGGASSNNLFYVPSNETIFGFNPAGSALGAPWPVPTGGETCGVAVTNTGEVWGGNYGQERVNKFTAAGASAGTFSLGYRVCKLAVDQSNNDLYIVHYSGGEITKYTAASGYTTTLNFPGTDGNAGIAINGAEHRLYVGNNSSTVEVYDTNTAAPVETINLGTSGGMGIAVEESTDTLFVTIGSGASGYIREYLGVKVPKATTGDPTGNTEVSGIANPDGAGDIVDCYFEFGTTTSYGSKQDCDQSLPITSEQPVSATLPGLLGEQQYHYRLAVETATQGSIGRGADKTITAHYMSELKTEPATEITRTTAQLNGSFIGTNEATSYYFEYGTTTAYGSRVPLAPAEQSAGTTVGLTPMSAIASGLDVATTYHFRVVATNPQGTSVGQDQSFTTQPAIKGLSTDPATDVTPTTAVLNGTLDPDGLATTFYFQYGKTTSYGQTVPAPPGSSVGTVTPGSTPVSTNVGNLESGKTYHYRLVGTNGTGTTIASDDQVLTTPEPPAVDAFSSANVTATSADLRALINPKGEETTYYFEYGTTPEYGSTAPASPGVLPAGNVSEDVTVPVTGLQGVTYHFRVVAENKWGTTTSGDQTFNFFPPGCPNAHLRQLTGAAYLPDCRAYELVSPPEAGPTILVPNGPPAPYASSPARFAFKGIFGYIDGVGEPTSVSDVYISTRTSEGWVTTHTGLRGNETALVGGLPSTVLNAEPGGDVYASLSLDRFLHWDLAQSQFGCCGENGSFGPYLWTFDGEPLGRLPSNLDEVPGAELDVTKDGFFGDGKPSPDLTHYVFSSNNYAFAPGGLSAAPGSAYDNVISNRSVSLISRTPAGADISAGVGGADEAIKFPMISTDGSHILMSTEAPGNRQYLYLRVGGGGGVTHDISLGQPVKFEGATPDGETIYFSSVGQLTADDQDTSVDLYMWKEQPTPSLSRISAGTDETGNADACGASWTAGCGVAVVNVDNRTDFAGVKVQPTDNAVAADTGDVYFYSPELFDNGRGVLGQRNLYVYRQGAPRYVATFTGSRIVNRIQVTPDGMHAALLTVEQLTAYDNAGRGEMYSYEPETRVVRCVSCIPDGSPPTSEVAASMNGLFMSDDGRIFFSTKDALVPLDANGLIDTYEFVDNRPQLISSGTADRDTADRSGPTGLVGVSADGVNVYFSTFDTLVGQDRNGSYYKFYNARTGGGFPFVPPPAPCAAADECHGPTAGPPLPPNSGTSALLGNRGNASPTARKKHRKGKRRRAARHKKHRGTNANRHRASHRNPNGKHG
jgi:hypothetical protein